LVVEDAEASHRVLLHGATTNRPDLEIRDFQIRDSVIRVLPIRDMPTKVLQIRGTATKAMEIRVLQIRGTATKAMETKATEIRVLQIQVTEIRVLQIKDLEVRATADKVLATMDPGTTTPAGAASGTIAKVLGKTKVMTGRKTTGVAATTTAVETAMTWEEIIIAVVVDSLAP